MVCEKIIGKAGDAEFAGKPLDYVDFEWHETYSKLHRKTSRGGRDIAIHLDDSVLKTGIKPGDVLGVDADGTVIAADVEAADVLCAKVGEPLFLSASKIAYEIGNCHAPLFAGMDDGELVTIYTEPMERLLKSFGAQVERRTQKLDFGRQISSVVGHSHHHHEHHGH